MEKPLVNGNKHKSSMCFYSDGDHADEDVIETRTGL